MFLQNYVIHVFKLFAVVDGDFDLVVFEAPNEELVATSNHVVDLERMVTTLSIRLFNQTDLIKAVFNHDAVVRPDKCNLFTIKFRLRLIPHLRHRNLHFLLYNRINRPGITPLISQTGYFPISRPVRTNRNYIVQLT